MKKWIAAAAVLLVAGCAADNDPGTNQSEARNTVQTNNLTQASSISNMGTGTVSVHQAPGNGFRWLDWFTRGRTPADNAGGQQGNAGAGTGAGTGGGTGAGTGVGAGAGTGAGAGAGMGAGTGIGTGTGAGTQQTASQFAQQVLTLVNQERANAGLNPLTMNDALSKMAMVKAQDMYENNYFSHDSPTYGSPFDMMKSFGIAYKWAGENIAKGQRNPAEVMNAWMNSPGHRANILSSNFSQIGIAYYNTEWVQAFIG